MIEPFKLVIYGEGKNEASFILTNFEKSYIFEEKADEGWEGGGYDWTSLIKVLLDEQMPELKGKINFDPEASMFVAYGLLTDIQLFSEKLLPLYNNDTMLRDALTRAELD